MSIIKLKEMSNIYGANPDYVLAGGGNTSFKDETYIYVKGSGVSLASIDEAGFVKMERNVLNNIFTKKYSDDEAQREAAVLKDMMVARCEGEENKRPSVETLLHEVLPFDFVLHIHPAMVNGMTCGKDGKKIFDKLFSDAIWIEPIMPGYILAVLVKDLIAKYTNENGKAPDYIFLENHGVFIGGNDTKEIDGKVEKMNSVLQSQVKTSPDFSAVDFNKEFAVGLAPAIRCLTSGEKLGITIFNTNAEILKSVSSKEEFASVYPTFTPDHMVYCQDETLFLESDTLEEAYNELALSLKKCSKMPKIIGVKNLGYYACGNTKKEAKIAADIFLDAVKVKHFANYFGEGKPLPVALIDAINNWEVERYRKSVSLSSNGAKRLNNKISIITGSAQGFGKGIAEDMAAEGSYVIIADLNDEGAKNVAKEINSNLNSEVAIGVKVNVGDETSIKDMLNETVLNFGGLDVFVSNAGIVRAGTIEEMDLNSFELVTKINYTAYFLCVKYAAAIMKIQYRFRPDLFSDIIQINSKSGLAGSNKNFAYAGGKFGGIGLTQSFALELTDFNIKVNSICPGNFLEGPLWNDPEKGLFVQYLNAGKVPGAKTIADVKRAYELKVPLKRGCLVKDVSRAIFYVVEQEYETGQAIPVTGGQEMLK